MTVVLVVCGAGVGFGAFFLAAHRDEDPPAAVGRTLPPSTVIMPVEPSARAPTMAPEPTPAREIATSRQALPAPPARVTIYLCKSYAGAGFWTSGTCSSQGATIDRISTVPGHLGFSDQVAIASREASEAALLYVAPPPAAAGSSVVHRARRRRRSARCSSRRSRCSTRSRGSRNRRRRRT